MNNIDLLFIAALAGLFFYNKKMFARWSLFLVVGYVLLKYFNVIEHLTPQETTARLSVIDKDIAYLKSVGITETSSNETMNKLLAEKKLLQTPIVASSSVTPAAVVMSSNLPPAPVITTTPIVPPKSVTSTPIVAPKIEEKKPEPWSPCSIESRGVI